MPSCSQKSKEVILMSAHNICFHRAIREIISKLSSHITPLQVLYWHAKLIVKYKIKLQLFIACPMTNDLKTYPKCTETDMLEKTVNPSDAAECGFWSWFLMTDSICLSSLLRTVLEKVTLTTIKFRIYLRTKVDPMFYCVYISMPLKSYPYRSSATCAWSMVSRWESLNTCANNKGANQPAHPHRLISAFVVHYSLFVYDEKASHKLKWRTEWYLEFISFS